MFVEQVGKCRGILTLISVDPKAIGLSQTGEGAAPEEIRATLYEALQRFAASQNTGTFDVFLRHYRVVLQPAPPGLVRCKSLAGTWVDLPQNISGAALLRGNGHQRAARQGQDRLITLTYDGAILAPDFTGDLVELIAAAIPVIAKEALGIEWQYIAKLTPLIEKARHVDQATVEATVRATNSISEFAAQMSVQKTFDIKAWPPSFFIGRFSHSSSLRNSVQVELPQLNNSFKSSA